MNTRSQAFRIYLGLCACVAPVLCGCRKGSLASESELPPGIVKVEGIFEDVGPRWSHRGDRIAFLRHTTDRKYQLCTASADLKTVTPLLTPETINPDRLYRTERDSYRAPECLAWSPDDRYIYFSRVEWMTFPDGDKLPGTAIWSYDTVTRTTTPFATHPPKYTGTLYYYRSPAVSPNGKHMAFVGEGLHGETALFVKPVGQTKADENVARYDSFQDIGWPVWSPDGTLLAFRQGALRGYTADPIESIRIIEPGGIRARKAWATTPERYDAALVKSSSVSGAVRSTPRVAAISWSPDGNQLAFSVAGDPQDLRTGSIWSVNLNPSNGSTSPALVAAASSEAGYTAPVWTDSTNLAAARLADKPYIVPVGSNVTKSSSSDNTVLPSTDFDWSPDRTSIVAAGTPTRPGSGPPPITTLKLITLQK